MKRHLAVAVALVLSTAVTVPDSAFAQRKKRAKEPAIQLTEQGKRLEARYAERLKAVQTEIMAALPVLDDQIKARFAEARAAEAAAEAGKKAALKELETVKRARGLVTHAEKYWIGKADRGIAEGRKALQEAATDAERAAAEEQIRRWQKDREAGVLALAERQEVLKRALVDEPRLKEQLLAAESALADARESARQAVLGMNLDPLLTSGSLDGKLARYEALSRGTPAMLAAFAERGEEQTRLVETLLADDELLVEMAVADGPEGNDYGRAMEIYTAILAASNEARSGVLRRLAVAVSLEHADAGVDDRIDPVKRYLAFEKPYLAGELDVAFDDLSTWDYRMVVDGQEPDEAHAWGREMLRNYRPDLATMPDYRWRYVALVTSDVQYGSKDVACDKPDLMAPQNILMNGGVCGRRASFGRFMLRSFGIPSIARPSTGHAALAHWTPQGWVVCLGPGWGQGRTKTIYKDDLDFLATTQARALGEAYMRVKRAQWIGAVVGDKPAYGLRSGSPGFWYAVSLYTQLTLIEAAKAEALAAVGEELGEADGSAGDEAFEAVPATDADRSVRIAGDVITIPAAACSKPTKSSGKIRFMPGHQGGLQLHYSRHAEGEPLEYTVQAPRAGRYQLRARVVTNNEQQKLSVATAGTAEPVDLVLPFTAGMWGTSDPVEIPLVAGENTLRFTRSHEKLKGITLKDFTLVPVR